MEPTTTQRNIPEFNNKNWIVIVLIILILGGGVFAYTKYNMSDTTNNKPEEVKSQPQVQTQKSSDITDEEKVAVGVAFSEIISLYKNTDVEGVKRYIQASGRTVADDETLGTSIESGYNLGFADLDKLENKKVIYEKGKYENGGVYIDMIVSGDLLEDKVSPTFIHTFDLNDGKWYWVNYEVQL